MQVTCSQCGSLLSSTATKCGVCGTILKRSDRPPEVPPAGRVPAKSPRIVLYGLIILAVAAYLIFLRGSNGIASDENYAKIEPGMTRQEVHVLLGHPINDDFWFSKMDTWKTGDGRTIVVNYETGFDKNTWQATSKELR